MGLLNKHIMLRGIIHSIETLMVEYNKLAEAQGLEKMVFNTTADARCNIENID